jgi:hypothetical protein
MKHLKNFDNYLNESNSKVIFSDEEQKLSDFFEENEFRVFPFEQDDMNCAEVEKWTDGGVDMVITLMPFTKEEFIDYVNYFDVDDEIDMHRQDQLYKNAFTISDSVKDFTDFQNHLKEIVEKLNILNETNSVERTKSGWTKEKTITITVTDEKILNSTDAEKYLNKAEQKKLWKGNSFVILKVGNIRYKYTNEKGKLLSNGRIM